MSQIDTEQLVVNMSMDIIRDQKRRTLYFHRPNQTGYQLDSNSDITKVKVYHLRFAISTLIYTIIQLWLGQLYSFGIVILLYIGMTLWFEKIFLKQKTTFRIKEVDLIKLEDVAVLKQKRTIEIYKALLILLIGLMEITNFAVQFGASWQFFAVLILVVGLWTFRINILWSTHKRYTDKKKSSEN